jgi:hypothetical protein
LQIPSKALGANLAIDLKMADEIYFISDFDLDDIPHTKVKAGDITPDAMSQTEQTEKWICDRQPN